MRVTIELPEAAFLEICELTGIRKKGPAIRKLIADALQLGKRVRISENFLTGEWSAELETFEATRQADRRSAQTLSQAWRD